MNRPDNNPQHRPARTWCAVRNVWILGVCGFGAIMVGGCNVNVRGKPRPLVRQDRIRGELEAVVAYRSDAQGTDVSRRESDTLVFEQRARIKTRGDVYHPDFLNYDVALGAGLAQQRFDAEDVSGWERDELPEYSASAQLLRAKPLTATANANRSDDLIPRQFLGSLRARREHYGGSVFLRSPSWPMMFQYSSSDTSQDGLTPLSTEFFRREDERFRYSVNHDLSESSHLHFHVDRTGTRQESAGAVVVDTDTDAYTLSHDYAFGGSDQHRLDSLFYYTDQTGSFEFENLRWQENLRLQHSSNLLTEYDFHFTDLQRGTLSSEEIRGRAGVEHRLYESLVTRVGAFVSETALGEQGNLSQHGGVAALNYKKNNPWGTLFSSYAFNLIRSDQSGGSGTGVVIDEPHVATELVPVLLGRPNIDISTIRVKDASGALFQENDDYTITERNSRVWLNITTLGLIPPNFTEGQDFFVDYEYFVEPERKQDTLRHRFTLRERFTNGVSLSYAFRHQKQDITSTTPGVRPDEFTINTLAADYANKGLFLLAEYSDEDSTLIPSTSRKLEGRYRWPVGSRTSASLRVSQQWLEFEEPDARDVTLFRAGTDVFSRLSGAYSLSGAVDYRDEEDTRFGDTRGFQFDTELRYQYRQFTATLGAELSFLRRRDDEISSVFLYLQMQRRF